MAEEHTLAAPRTARRRHSRMSLAGCQNTPAVDTAIYRPNGTLYQLQPSFYPQSTEPEPTARARRAGEEFYQTTLEVYVRFLPFVGGRVHPGRLDDSEHD